MTAAVKSKDLWEPPPGRQVVTLSSPCALSHQGSAECCLPPLTLWPICSHHSYSLSCQWNHCHGSHPHYLCQSLDTRVDVTTGYLGDNEIDCGGCITVHVIEVWRNSPDSREQSKGKKFNLCYKTSSELELCSSPPAPDLSKELSPAIQ